MKLHAIIKANIRQMLFVLALFTLMVIVSCLFMNQIVRSEIAVSAYEMLARTEISVYSVFRELETSVFGIAVDLRDRLDSGQSPKQIETYMARLNHELNGSHERYARFISVGGLIRGDSVGGTPRTQPGEYKPEECPWYKAARAAGDRIAITGPYTDLRTGADVISLSRNLRGSNGEDYGVLALNLDTEALWENVSSLQFENGGHGIITDANGNIIVHPDKNLKGLSLQAAGRGYARVTERIREGEASFSTAYIVNDSGKREISFFRKTSGGRYIGITFPLNSYYRDVYLMVTVLILLGAVSMLVLDYFLLRLSMEKLHSEEESAGKSSFLAKMSHEIRTPLNSILGMSELILRKDVPRDLFEYVSIIRQAGSNLLAIINDILDFSKIEAGQLEICCEKYCFASLINDVINVIRVRLLDKSVVFSVKVDSCIPDCLLGDEARVRQILLNLLGNAVKYTHAGHISLDVTAEPAGDGNVRLIFRVEDSGIGIRESDMDKLFRDFTRIETPQDRDVEGTGLGLAISRNLCRSMGGDISVTSAYGKGSVFTATVLQTRDGAGRLAFVDRASEKRVLIFEERPICLDALVHAMTSLGVYPVCAQNPTEFNLALANGDYDFAFISSEYAADCVFTLGGSKSPTVLVSMVELGEFSPYRETRSITRPIFCTGVANILNNASDAFPADPHRAYFSAPDVKILIVDDISTNLRVSKELMAFYGMEIHTCLSGAEAIELVRTNRYDIVFMDHMMPGMDGVETTAAIRAIDENNSYYKNLPIIALTANALSGQREMFLQNGMNGFLSKPIEMQKLDAVLRKWIPEKKRRRTEIAANGTCKANRSAGFEIEGVSAEMGLRNSGSSVAVYADILLDFCRDADERAERIDRCLREDNIGLYLTLVHALKGAARSVGATEFAEFAARVEEVAQNGDVEVLATTTGKLLAALRKLTNEIRRVLDARFSGEKGESAAVLSVARLKKLRSALIDMDIAVVNELMLECVGAPFDFETKKELSEIERLILLFEYDAAIDRIDLLIDAVS